LAADQAILIKRKRAYAGVWKVVNADCFVTARIALVIVLC
jgi:hypothetical protein